MLGVAGQLCSKESVEMAFLELLTTSLHQGSLDTHDLLRKGNEKAGERI